MAVLVALLSVPAFAVDKVVTKKEEVKVTKKEVVKPEVKVLKNISTAKKTNKKVKAKGK